MLLLVLTGWLDRKEREALAYLIEENRVLRRQLRGRRLRLTETTGDGLPCGRIGWDVTRYARSRRSSRPTRCCAGIGSSSRGNGHIHAYGHAVAACWPRSGAWWC